MDWLILSVVLLVMGVVYHRAEKRHDLRYREAAKLLRDNARALADHGDGLRPKLKEKRS